MIQHHKAKHSGFTIVELMIAITFVSLLLLAIAMTVMHIGGVYNKGLVMKSVNQAGRVIVADIKQSVEQNQPFPAVITKQEQGTTVRGGRLCTGTYSYIWNIGRETSRQDPANPAFDPNFQINKYDGTADEQKRPLRLVKIRDSASQYCGPTAKAAIDPGATELLSESNLAIQDFKVEQLTANTGSGMALYEFTIRISDADNEAITSVGECKTPGQNVTYQNYCSVNEFVFTAKASGKE